MRWCSARARWACRSSRTSRKPSSASICRDCSAWPLATARPGLGLKVADATAGPGAYVGGVREGSPGERAGVQVGDVVVELSGRPVSSASDLEQIAARRVPGQATSLMVRRDGQHQTLILH